MIASRPMQMTWFSVMTMLLVFSGSRGGAQTSEKETLPGAQNYTRVDRNVACGGAIAFDALPELKRRGFKAVINLRLPTEPNANVEAEGEAVRTAGLKYINLPFNVAAPNARAIVDEFMKAVVDPANQPVYIHSNAAHRVGGMWLIKRVRLDGWSVERALAEAENIGLSDSSRQFALDYVKIYSK